MSSKNMKLGTFYGVGLGSGDPELMTLKAVRILQNTKLISYFSKGGIDGGKTGHARAIMQSYITSEHSEMPLIYPVTTQYPVTDPRYTTLIGEFYEQAAKQIADKLSAGEDVALLCVGDPFFYGSFMHLYRRLVGTFPCHVTAGVTAMSGCWTSAGLPVTWGDDVLTVLPATLDAAELTRRLQNTDAAVIMKLGRNLAKVRQAIAEANLSDRATYVEYGTMENERIYRLCDKKDDDAPYFSLIIITGNGRRI